MERKSEAIVEVLNVVWEKLVVETDEEHVEGRFALVEKRSLTEKRSLAERRSCALTEKKTLQVSNLALIEDAVAVVVVRSFPMLIEADL